MPLYEELQRSQSKLVAELLATLQRSEAPVGNELLKALTANFAYDSARWIELRERYQREHLELWTRLVGNPSAGSAPPADTGRDPRFRAREWRELPYFHYLRDAYLLNSRWIAELVEAVDVDPRMKNKLRFYARQFADALAPTNFAATNPEAIKLAWQTHGESVMRGLANLNADLQKGRISMTDESAFEIGRDIALTPGSVVYRNELIELIQYSPTTNDVHERPLVIVPPCINKYYILDLQPENSLVRYAVAEGHTVFMVSWRNVREELGHVTWDQYLENGILAALNVARDICGTDQVNALGFCVGGTLLACALAVERAKGRDPAASLTLLATMLDYSDCGELAVYVDRGYVEQREREFAGGGILRGAELAFAFATLRANDLIWRNVVDHYLKGRAPQAFDLLYWNSDSTNLPGAMYAYYVRNMYLENNLRVPGRLAMCGVPVDLRCIDAPAYVLASREDHIVPWKTAYENTRLLGGKVTFALAASGHIAGVINPPAHSKRHYWTSESPFASGDDWLATAQQHPGSWWTHWSAWLAGSNGARIAARTPPGSSNHPALGPAPGDYVRERCA
jgi:polyhydroxyalkanoate synthase